MSSSISNKYAECCSATYLYAEALANFSPGLERSDNHGFPNQFDITLKSLSEKHVRADRQKFFALICLVTSFSRATNDFFIPCFLRISIFPTDSVRVRQSPNPFRVWRVFEF